MLAAQDCDQMPEYKLKESLWTIKGHSSIVVFHPPTMRFGAEQAKPEKIQLQLEFRTAPHIN